MNGGTSSDQYLVQSLQVPEYRNHYNPSSCVSYVKSRRPDQVESWGTPNNVKPVYSTPFVGAIGLTTEGPVGHAFYVEEVTDKIRVSECNYIPGKCSQRWLEISDPVIRGYR